MAPDIALDWAITNIAKFVITARNTYNRLFWFCGFSRSCIFFKGWSRYSRLIFSTVFCLIPYFWIAESWVFRIFDLSFLLFDLSLCTYDLSFSETDLVFYCFIKCNESWLTSIEAGLKWNIAYTGMLQIFWFLVRTFSLKIADSWVFRKNGWVFSTTWVFFGPEFFAKCWKNKPALSFVPDVKKAWLVVKTEAHTI